MNAALAPAWLGLAAYGASSTRVVWGGQFAAPVVALNLVLLAVEVALGGFALFLVGALAAPPAPAPPARRAGSDAPRVLLLVPVYREHAPVLGETLAAAGRLRWPRERLRTVVVDDTPAGPAADALREAAAAHGVAYFRRPERRGYKAGALNDALAAHAWGDVVAVLDVDHVPEPDWLERAMPVLLSDGSHAYAQGRLAWRNADSPIRRLQAILQAQFYEIIQRAKGARGVAVFAGSGAIFRRGALDAVGGFPEDTLVEDFDLTVEFLTRGWRGAYVPAVVARGLLPWTSGDLARQLWRWAHGTTRVLLKQAPRIVGRRDAPWRVRVECMTDASAYGGAGLFVVAAALLAAAGLAGLPLPRAWGGGALLMGAGLVLAAHALTAIVALARAGERGYRWVVPYHVMSLAFTPVVFAAVAAALLGRGQSAEGRVAKDFASAASRAGRGVRGAAVAAAGLGAALVGAAAAFFADGSLAWVWTVELGLAFMAPLVAGVIETQRLADHSGPSLEA